MPKTVTTKLYQYAELSEKAKEKAREWWMKHCEHDNWQSDQEWVYEDTTTIAAALGIDIDKIWYTGFWSQGDGACFDGSYKYKKGWPKALAGHMGSSDPKEIAKHRVPMGEKQMAEFIEERKKLIALGERFQKVQKKYFYRVQATVKHTGRYYHEYCTNVTVYTEDDDGWGGYEKAIDAADDTEVTDILREYMRYIYRRLEETYEWTTSEERIAEDFESNPVTFTKNGRQTDAGDLIDEDDEDEDEDEDE